MEDLAGEPVLEPAVFHREHDLDAAEEISGHPVRASEQDFRVACVLEVKNAAVLQELVYHTGYSNALRQSRNSGPQAAGSPNHQLDTYSGTRGAIECIDDGGLDQRVHFDDDPGRPAHLRIRGFAVNQLHDLLPQAERCDHELTPAPPLGVPGEEVE